MRYSPPLDGIRAIAILAVLLFHIAPARLTGGFTGVDVFFVLSGFLITSIILHDLKDGSFSLREFYLRRVQRLLPNVVLTVSVSYTHLDVYKRQLQHASGVDDAAFSLGPPMAGCLCTGWQQ